ncbi:hypothetical protein ASG29_04100 [Sphingomonas sp. Leaf412]|uniref:glycosyltransferase family 4 protein n=1 Tax=Sphingomonas sp. Leaf412 TaxID=1736370 RepID=UPI000700413B|nr:glycosyltransferase family 4 protein [Sphingomonas sp. Leaf412]KQT35288.1 hypothetical protein ASG29_04100 [Sphingomonas sp. Leaf412]
MRVAVVSQGSPYRRSSWSGIPYYALREIMRRFDDVHVVDTPRVDEFLRRSTVVTQRRWNLTREPAVLRVLAAGLAPMVDRIRPDVVVSIGAPHKVVPLLGRYPVVHVTDAMFDTIVRYYPSHHRIRPRTLRLGGAIQQRLVNESHGLLVASRWAAESAASFYGHDVTRFTIAPLGANFDLAPPARAPRTTDGPLRFLFAGFDWVRKGGPLALATFARVRAAVPDAQFHIVGCTPDEARGMPGVTVHGILSKSEPAQAQAFERLFDDSHFFLMPSRQEAFGLVYCEACAFSLPSVAADTGGVGEIVRDGVNGLLLPPDGGAADYAAAILSVWRDPARYRDMQAAARTAFEQRLNWEAWGAQLEGAMATIRPDTARRC